MNVKGKNNKFWCHQNPLVVYEVSFAITQGVESAGPVFSGERKFRPLSEISPDTLFRG
jgi:hypothetical protein